MNDLTVMEEKSENVVENVINWQPWEMLLHIAVVILFIFVAYLFVVSPEQRSLTNYLLLLIAFGVAVQIHQNINIQGRMMKLN